MAELIRKTKANGVVFVSGDVHWGEISKRSFDDLYPIYDITASGITEDWHNVEPNRYRVKQAFRKNHFGMIEIDWKKERSQGKHADPQRRRKGSHSSRCHTEPTPAQHKSSNSVTMRINKLNFVHEKQLWSVSL